MSLPPHPDLFHQSPGRDIPRIAFPVNPVGAFAEGGADHGGKGFGGVSAALIMLVDDKADLPGLIRPEAAGQIADDLSRTGQFNRIVFL